MKILTCAVRGRSDGGWHSSSHEQRLEIGNEISNCVTNVAKDSLLLYIKSEKNMYVENKKSQLPIELNGKKFKIRKLTPRECFRLMGVDEEDIDKIQQAKISESQQYRLAGNAIVVDVLYYIFYKMFINTEKEYQQGEQLTLF